jgi:trehalose 6-phosphate phosphatase
VPEEAPASPGWPEAFTREPSRVALLTDFDGTLSPIVADPQAARPLPEAIPLLSALAERLAVVGVVSGRPLSFIAERLGVSLDRPGSGAASPGLRLAGLYGLEQVGSDGAVHTSPEARRWRPVLDQLANAARAEGPQGLVVEHKGLAVTLHWRQAPGVGEPWAARFVEDRVRESGLVAVGGRMSVELLPPTVGDKGTVVLAWARGCAAAAYLGDDRGDLPAFGALDELARSGTTVRKVAVAGPDVPAALTGAADVVVRGPEGALALLSAWRDQLSSGGHREE